MPVNGISATSGGGLAPPPSKIMTQSSPDSQPLVIPPRTINPSELLMGGVFSNIEMIAKGEWVPSSTMESIPVDANATAGNVVFNLPMVNEHTNEAAKLVLMLADRANFALEYLIQIFSASTVIGAVSVGTTIHKLDNPTLQDLVIIQGELVKMDNTLQFTTTLGMTVPGDGVKRHWIPTHEFGQYTQFPDPSSLDLTVFPHLVMIQNAPLKTNISGNITGIDVRFYSRLSKDTMTSIESYGRIKAIYDSLKTTTSSVKTDLSLSNLNGGPLSGLFRKDKIYVSTDGVLQADMPIGESQINSSYFQVDRSLRLINPGSQTGWAPEGVGGIPDRYALRPFTLPGDIPDTYACGILDRNTTVSIIIQVQNGDSNFMGTLVHCTYSNNGNTHFTAYPLNFLSYGQADHSLDFVENASTISTFTYPMNSLVSAGIHYLASLAELPKSLTFEFVTNLANAMLGGYESKSIDGVVSQTLTGIVPIGNQITVKDYAVDKTVNVTLLTDGLRVSTTKKVMTFFPWIPSLPYSSTVSTALESTDHKFIYDSLSVPYEDINYILGFYASVPKISDVRSVPETYVRVIFTEKIPPNVTTAYNVDGFPSYGCLPLQLELSNPNSVLIFDLVTPENNQRIMSVAYSAKTHGFFARFPAPLQLYAVLNNRNAAELVLRNLRAVSIGNFPDLSMPLRLLSRVQQNSPNDALILPVNHGPLLRTVKRSLIHIVSE